MRFGIVCILVYSIIACSKRERRTNQLEGEWVCTQLLHNDGSSTYYNRIFHFENGNADGKTYLPLTVCESDTTNGYYLITKKGDQLILRYDVQNPGYIDTCKIEDMDANHLYLRATSGVFYFVKK
jgi:hypothetical protein